jgi:hypothetical protein
MNKEQATQLLNSPRGLLILNQAFHHGIKSLESVKPDYLKEVSNIHDMKELREHIFNQFPAEVFEPVRKEQGKNS